MKSYYNYSVSSHTWVLQNKIIYELLGDKVIYETNGTYGLLFHYDYDGTLIGFTGDLNINDGFGGADYFYIRNQQGDITMIVDDQGTVLVEYRYDAYGNRTIVFDYTSGILSTYNPYTYKGYRYDQEIGLYYLNSRYYNPAIGRFLNSDGILGQTGNVLSTNMYAYCVNNPVMYSDITGFAPEWLNAIENWFEDHWAEIAIGAAFIIVGAVVTALTCGTGVGFMAALGSALATSMTQVGISAAISVGIGGLVSLSQGGGFFDNVGDSLASGLMWGGIFAGGAQILSGGFKLLAQQGFKGFGQFLSPDRLRGATEIANMANRGQTIYNTGGRLASFGFGAIDVGTKAFLHMHLWFTAAHIPLGTILGGVIGGF
jgi:RHS repeat-associated protein